ncbi:hypothetical protein LTR53_011210, partial [Teratosphaeriaceae sp. CCFEE 6253]
MDTYQKPLHDVDAALRRLNATLESYKISATSKAAPTPSPRTAAPVATPVPDPTVFRFTAAAPARPPAPAPSNGVQVNGGHTRPAATPAEPLPRATEYADWLAELPQNSPDELWRETLALRFWPAPDHRTPPPDLPDMPGGGDQASIGRQLQHIVRMQRYLVEYPYLLPLRIVIAQKYLQLGYPDLASGEAYKALLLCDAIHDASDEYHGPASAQLREFIQQIPLVERIRLLKGELQDGKGPPPREPDEDMDVEVDIWIREHYKPWAFRLLALGLVRCGCLKSARFYANQGLVSLMETGEDFSDPWLVEVSRTAQMEAEKSLGVREDPDSNDYPDQGMVRREVYPWNEWEPDRLRSLPELNAMMSDVAPKLEVRAVELPLLTGSGESTT